MTRFKLFLISWVLPLSVLLGACDGPSPDGYKFEQAQYVQTDLDVSLVLVANQEELLKLAPEHIRSENLMAFSTLRRDQTGCTIYAVDARSDYQPEWIGHELTHCIYGEWHPKQNKERQR